MTVSSARTTSAVSDAFRPSRPRGLLYALLSGLILSTGGLFLRALEPGADQMAVVACRSGALGASMFLVLFIRYRGEVVASFRNIGRKGILGAALLGLGYPGYVLALMNTTVANALLVMCAGPLVAAALGWAFLRERVRLSTWMAIAGTVAGVAVMVSGELAAHGLLGIGAAAFTTVAVAAYTVVTRRQQAVDMLPAICLAGLLASAIGVAGADSLVLPSKDVMLCLFMGSVQVMAGFALMTLAARHAPAAEVALVGLAEMVFGPVLAWLIVGELPGNETLLGGALVFGSVLAFAIAGVRTERSEQRAAPPPQVLPARTDRIRGLATSLQQADVRSEDPSSAIGRRAVVSREVEAHVRAAPEAGLTDAVVLPAETQATADARRPSARAVDFGADAETIERALRSALKPHLQRWVDENAGIVVDRMVRDELRALVREGREEAARRPWPGRKPA
jgi:drug/metabolite transporter (DMT)-like permease